MIPVKAFRFIGAMFWWTMGYPILWLPNPGVLGHELQRAILTWVVKQAMGFSLGNFLTTFMSFIAYFYSQSLMQSYKDLACLRHWFPFYFICTWLFSSFSMTCFCAALLRSLVVPYPLTLGQHKWNGSFSKLGATQQLHLQPLAVSFFILLHPSLKRKKKFFLCFVLAMTPDGICSWVG